LKAGMVARHKPRSELLQTDAPERVGLVLNPVALKNERRPEVARALLKAFNKLGEAVQLDDSTDLGGKFAEWKQEGLDLLVISGGDGTMQLVIGELLSVWSGEPPPRLLLIHGGTGGIVPTSTGNPDPMEALAHLKRALRERRPLHAQILRTLRIGDRVTFSCGIGVFRRLVSEYSTYWGSVDWSRIVFAARFAGSWLVWYALLSVGVLLWGSLIGYRVYIGYVAPSIVTLVVGLLLTAVGLAVPAREFLGGEA